MATCTSIEDDNEGSEFTAELLEFSRRYNLTQDTMRCLLCNGFTSVGDIYCLRERDIDQLALNLAQKVRLRDAVERQETPMTRHSVAQADPPNEHMKTASESISPLQGVSISKAQLDIREKIGEGFFGIVYKAELHRHDRADKEPTIVAAKTISKYCQPEDVKAFLKEAAHMKDLNHPNVIRLLGVLEHDGKPHMVLPYMAHGNLRSYIKDTTKILEVPDLLDLGLQVAEGMNYLAGQKYVHGDLAARNCLLSGDGTVKISDFGLARHLDLKDYYRIQTPGATPVKWMAPEVLLERKYTMKSDVWSFGVLLWELLTRGSAPYAKYHNIVIVSVLQKGERLPHPAGVDQEIYDFMLTCWNYDFDKRPSFRETCDWMETLLESLKQPSRRPVPLPRSRKKGSTIDRHKVFISHSTTTGEELNKKILPPSTTTTEEETYEDTNLYSSSQTMTEEFLTSSSTSTSDYLLVDDTPEDIYEDGYEVDKEYVRLESSQSTPDEVYEEHLIPSSSKEHTLPPSSMHIPEDDIPYEDWEVCQEPPIDKDKSLARMWPSPPTSGRSPNAKIAGGVRVLPTLLPSSIKPLKNVTVKIDKSSHRKLNDECPHFDTSNETPSTTKSSPLFPRRAQPPPPVSTVSHPGEKFDTLTLVQDYSDNQDQLKEKSGGSLEQRPPLHSADPTTESWFHGQLSGTEAEKLLLDKTVKNYSFLVRDSLRQPGDFALSVKAEEKVTHVMIRCQDGKFHIAEGDQFDSLPDLIDHYSRIPIITTTNIVLHLKQPIKRARISVSGIHDRVKELEKESNTSNQQLSGGAGFSGV